MDASQRALALSTGSPVTGESHTSSGGNAGHEVPGRVVPAARGGPAGAPAPTVAGTTTAAMPASKTEATPAPIRVSGEPLTVFGTELRRRRSVGHGIDDDDVVLEIAAVGDGHCGQLGSDNQLPQIGADVGADRGQ